jgi:hypothetical protein
MTSYETKILKEQGFYFVNQQPLSVSERRADDEKKERQRFFNSIKKILWLGHLKDEQNIACFLRKGFLSTDIFKLILSFVFSESWSFTDKKFPLIWQPHISGSPTLIQFVSETNREGFKKLLDRVGLKLDPQATKAEKELFFRISGLTMTHEIEFFLRSPDQKELVKHSCIEAKRFTEQDMLELRNKGVYVNQQTDFRVLYKDGTVDIESFYMTIFNPNTKQKTVIFSGDYERASVGHSNPWNPEFFEQVQFARRKKEPIDLIIENDRNRKNALSWLGEANKVGAGGMATLFENKNQANSVDSNSLSYGIFCYLKESDEIKLLPFQNVDALQCLKSEQSYVLSFSDNVVTIAPKSKQKRKRRDVVVSSSVKVSKRKS